MPVTVQVRLRHGRYDAGSIRPSIAEWPPHPARVFCALVASAQSVEDWDALRWLERSGAPYVWADGCVSVSRTDSFVVTNQTEPGGGSQFWPGRTNQARSRASATPAGENFAVVWPEAETTGDLLTRLERMARRIPYVGRSTSQAEVTTIAMLPAEQPAWSRWAPSRIGATNTVDLRVPYPGYVDALREVYELGGRAWEVARAVPYTQVVEQVSLPVKPVRSPWDDLMIWGFGKPTARIGGDQVLRLTSTLRKAVLKRVGADIPAQVSGHGADDRPHVAFLALPDVGHEHADGHLLGVALAVPRDMPAEEWKQLVRALIGANPLTRLTPRPMPEISLRYGADPRRRTLRVETWRGPAEGACSWVTATPMVTDGMMRARRSMEDLVAKSLARVGYPEPVDLEVSAAPLTRGAVWRPRQETLPEGRPKRPMAHVRVRFARPVIGPVIAGSLRYLGLGLFAPEREQP
ncbi:type I-U CRISPR-associated protein Csb2 [Sphaerisporangium sp. NPDC051011]|uniref:type I-G CRISPR-associated protein Csb2 n=1 Tax=Sphaerisporangium sp. NPDC051011 TaxID=3155792 RepID=UPI0033E7F0A7